MTGRAAAAARHDPGPLLRVAPSGTVDLRLLAEQLKRLEILPASDPLAAYAPAVEIERTAKRLGAVQLEMRARLIQADVMGRMGKTTAGGQLLREVNTWAVEHRDPHLLARSHRLLAMFFDRIGDFAAGLEHALRAVELLEDNASSRLRADHLFGLGMALIRLHSFDEARERYRRVLEIAQELADDALTVKVLNDMAWLEDEAGNPERSLQLALHMQAFASDRGLTLDAACLDTLAHAHVQLGRYEDAAATLQPLLDDTDLSARETEGLAEALRTAAAAQRGLRHFAAAQDILVRCLDVCAERHLADVRVQVLEDQASLFADEGRWREAYEQRLLFHREWETLHSTEREARSRTLQAVFEVTEARREGQRFRELAFLDALTGLPNRRYVDTELPALLRAASEAGKPLSLALADLDFFKRINDTLSHPVGDEVLRRVAALLDHATGEAGFAARVGGEEFLLVLPGISAAEAAKLWEAVRHEIASYPWHALTAGIPVTVSIGGTSLSDQRSTQSALLGQADRNLYAAKRCGRDCVVTDD